MLAHVGRDERAGRHQFFSLGAQMVQCLPGQRRAVALALVLRTDFGVRDGDGAAVAAVLREAEHLAVGQQFVALLRGVVLEVHCTLLVHGCRRPRCQLPSACRV
jgi:hypothetical protein